MRKLSTLILALAAALGSVASHGAAITNGSFETADLSGWGGTATADGNGYNPFGTTYGSGMDGTHWMWLAGFEIGRTLNQSITGLTSGNSYRIRFIMASEYTHSDQLNVSIDGLAQTLYTVDPITSTFWDNWQEKTYDFVASGTSALLEFSSVGLNESGYDVGLDNVRIEELTNVPEPASLALVGISLFGLAASRRRQLRA